MPYCTRVEVKTAMGWAVGETTHDALIDELLDDVTSRIDEILGRSLDQTTFTEYLDGGHKSVVLSYGPVISITSVHDDSAHEFGASTLIASTDYFLDPNASIVRMNVGRFTRSDAGVKVIYSAGYASGLVPKAVRRICIREITIALNTRLHPELTSQSHRDGSVSKMDPEAVEDRLRRNLAPFMRWAG